MKKLNTSKEYIDKISKYRVRCSFCGHSVFLIRQKFVICNWCGHKIYKNKQEEFKDKVKQELKSHH